ncbi:MAG: hypothetical protein AAEI92_00615 [Arenicellales bacterium]|jgi:hypothetical protein
MKSLNLTLSSPLRWLAGAVILTFSLSTLAADFDPFFGRYAGSATVVGNTAGNVDSRKITVDISKHKKGFRVYWSTTKPKTGKSKEYTIDFVPTKRDHIYAAAQKINVFGGKKPLDPLQGDPYMWARFTGNNMKVLGLLINEQGEFELFSYTRTLHDDGQAMSLRYLRLDEMGEQRVIEGELRRQAD